MIANGCSQRTILVSFREPIQQKKNRLRHSSDRLHHLNLLWNSWRRACVKARPTTWAPTIMIWAINLACREILWSPLVAQKHQEVVESQNTHHFKEKVSTYAIKHVVSDILFGSLLVPRPSSGLLQLVSSPNVLSHSLAHGQNENSMNRR